MSGVTSTTARRRIVVKNSVLGIIVLIFIKFTICEKSQNTTSLTFPSLAFPCLTFPYLPIHSIPFLYNLTTFFYNFAFFRSVVRCCVCVFNFLNVMAPPGSRLPRMVICRQIGSEQLLKYESLMAAERAVSVLFKWKEHQNTLPF